MKISALMAAALASLLAVAAAGANATNVGHKDDTFRIGDRIYTPSSKRNVHHHAVPVSNVVRNDNRLNQKQGQHQGQSQSQKVRNAGNNTGNSSSTSVATLSNATTQSNANASTGNVTSVQGSTYIQQAPPRNPVAGAMAAPLSSSNDTCMGSSSGGAQGVSFGVSFGSTWTDGNCVMLKNATMLWNMGKQDAAVALLCTNEQMRQALEVSGTACPRPQKPSQKSRAATYDTNDPFIAARMHGNEQN